MKNGIMDFDGDLNEIDGFGMWFEWFFKWESWHVKMAWLMAHLREEKNLDLGHFIFWTYSK